MNTMSAVLRTDKSVLPLTDRAYHALRQALIRCEFEPGQRLRVEDLQRRFGLSSSPLREALNRLVQHGLVNSFENRGFRVAPITVEAINDLTRVRLLIETEALKDALKHGDDLWEGAVVATFHNLSLVEKRLADTALVLDENWSERHRAFHLSIYSACSSPILLGLVENLFDHAERFRLFSARHRKVVRSKGNEHKNIVDAVLARDQEQAVKLVQQHIRSTERNVSESLQSLSKDQLAVLA
ncbi:MAG TPA: GntR family transcriptional regulator [Eoetvoesiella sp.]